MDFQETWCKEAFWYVAKAPSRFSQNIHVGGNLLHLLIKPALIKKISYYQFRKLLGQNPQNPSRRSSLRRNSQEQRSFHCLFYKTRTCKVSGSCYYPSWSILFTNNLVSCLSMYYLIFEGKSLLHRLSFWFPDGNATGWDSELGNDHTYWSWLLSSLQSPPQREILKGKDFFCLVLCLHCLHIDWHIASVQ